MILLPSFYYRNILAENNGPVSRVTVRNVKVGESQMWEAYVYLIDGLRDKGKFKIYGNADGCGTSDTKGGAFYKATSEALERWAFSYAKNDPAIYEKTGLHIDRTTTGFAALPEFGSSRTRRKAFLEAHERWLIQQWWLEKIGCERYDMSSTEFFLSLRSPLPVSTVIYCRRADTFFVYGFASDTSQKIALQRAMIEAERNYNVLTKPVPSFAELGNIEKRLVYFSTIEGNDLFLAKTKNSLTVKLQVPAPKLLVDCEITGPWTKYCRVWRCLFEETESQRSDELFFSF